MVALNRGASCRDAEPYYYDFQLDPNNPAVPDSVTGHIKDCAYCQEALRRLEGLLAESETGGTADRPQDDAELIDALSLHFEYIGDYVTCAHVKPFLPALAMPSGQIRIPTPITVHVDNCPQCAADLDAIRGLHLRAEQLARLSRLLGKRPSVNSAMCRRAEASIAALGSDSPTGIADEIWDHLCVCPRCRARLCEHREAVLERQRATGSDAGVSACEGLCPAEIFDYVIPCGLTAAELESATAAHVWTCPACLENMQALHQTLFDIADRADSDTATVYAAKDRAAQAHADGNDQYARYGIHVRVLEKTHEPATARFRPAIKPFVKVAALAAVIPLAIFLFVQTRSASGTGPEEITNAFARAANVHVQLFHSDSAKPTQQQRAIRRAGLFMTTSGDTYTLYDLQARTKTTADPVAGIIGPVALGQREYAGARDMMEHSLGFTLASVPVDRQWREVARNVDEGTETYELTWTAEGIGGRSYQAKWEVVIDSQTRCPMQTRLLRRYAPEDEWEVSSRRKLEYPPEQAIRSAIAERFPGWVAAPI